MQTGNLRLYALLSTIGAWMVIAMSLAGALVIVLWAAYHNPYNELGLLTGLLVLSRLAINVVFLGSAIPVLLWVYTACANLRNAGIKGLRHSPGWATFSFFVPFANLYIPFTAMRELANRSAGEPEDFAHSSVDEVTSWWGCWVASAIVMSLVTLFTFIDAIPGVHVIVPTLATMLILMFGQILFAASAFFLTKVLWLVTNNQINGAVDLSEFE
ncbi:MAG: DUF4328 domain-containing protein [Porphyrobacter sp.]|nr:DUF4328 domain-containing protein [Porphyrobacter sp.]